MSDNKKILAHSEVVSKAGKARAESLSPERRAEIAKNAGLSKGKRGLPRATYGGSLKIGEKEIECGVLPNKTRVISCVSIRSILGLSQPNAEKRKRSKEENLPTFLISSSITPYLSDISSKEPFLINFVNKFGQKVEGMKAEFLPKICEIYLQARADGVLSKPQLPIARECEIILTALAQIGIIALVDEASSYQEERAKDELQTLLKGYISEELRQWTKKFPNEFFKQVYRLHEWQYPNIDKETMRAKNHPQYVGQLINKYIYDRLPPGVKEELEKRNPTNEKGTRTHRHHQFLTEDIGDDNLQKQITQVVTLMRVSDDLESFKNLMDKLK